MTQVLAHGIDVKRTASVQSLYYSVEFHFEVATYMEFNCGMRHWQLQSKFGTPISTLIVLPHH